MELDNQHCITLGQLILVHECLRFCPGSETQFEMLLSKHIFWKGGYNGKDALGNLNIYH